ncbi:MAG: membrane or secreted protein [Brumimicrobium sp.]|nr:membrane or secreted protein [Brumimicrobium sp.]MCO5269991.1 membrane or secreted protein [Brumimicrobium sp.]
MAVVLIAIALLAVAFAGIAVKILIKKDGKFSGTCASNNPVLQEKGAVCGLCGAKPEEKCKADE